MTQGDDVFDNPEIRCQKLQQFLSTKRGLKEKNIYKIWSSELMNVYLDLLKTSITF